MELPLLAKDPFMDDFCNCFTQQIFDYMKGITKEKNKKKV